MKSWRGIKGWVIALAAVIGIGYLLWQMNDQQQVVRLHGNTYHVDVMKTADELERGLSGTDSLPAGRGMLFVFPNDNKWAIWMKDMKYPIDIVWLNKDTTVVYMVKNAQPDSYPDKQFTPNKNARYVIELASGTIERTGITIGDFAGLPSGI